MEEVQGGDIIAGFGSGPDDYSSAGQNPAALFGPLSGESIYTIDAQSQMPVTPTIQAVKEELGTIPPGATVATDGPWPYGSHGDLDELALEKTSGGVQYNPGVLSSVLQGLGSLLSTTSELATPVVKAVRDVRSAIKGTAPAQLSGTGTKSSGFSLASLAIPAILIVAAWYLLKGR